MTLTGASDSQEKLARKDAELALADQVIVASSFTRDTLQSANIGGKPVHVVPYGAPEFRGSVTARKPGGRLAGFVCRVAGSEEGIVLSDSSRGIPRFGSGADFARAERWWKTARP